MDSQGGGLSLIDCIFKSSSLNDVNTFELKASNPSCYWFNNNSYVDPSILWMRYKYYLQKLKEAFNQLVQELIEE